jgi:hypothetical protein
MLFWMENQTLNLWQHVPQLQGINGEMKKNKVQMALKIHLKKKFAKADVTERRHKEKLERQDKFLDLFQQMVQKM